MIPAGHRHTPRDRVWGVKSILDAGLPAETLRLTERFARLSASSLRTPERSRCSRGAADCLSTVHHA